MATMISPEMTADERLTVRVAGAHAAVEAGHDDLALVERRRTLYERCATYLAAFADRQEAEVALAEADARFKAASQHPNSHTDDVLAGRDLIARGVAMLDLGTFDTRRDPDRLREAASIFADLAAAG